MIAALVDQATATPVVEDPGRAVAAVVAAVAAAGVAEADAIAVVLDGPHVISSGVLFYKDNIRNS